METIYRKAKVCDLNPLCNLWDKLDRSHVRYHPTYILDSNIFEKRKRYIKKQLRSKKGFIYVAEHKGRIIGFIHGRIEDSPSILKIKKIGYLATIFIEKKYRGKGIGAELFRMLLKEFKKRKLRFVKTNVDIRNSSAIRFYKKVGFKNFKFNMMKDI